MLVAVATAQVVSWGILYYAAALGSYEPLLCGLSGLLMLGAVAVLVAEDPHREHG